jgi:undecaprenyl-diphosphatase
VVSVVWFHIFLLALVQGITEFLPISSSGHLVMIWEGLDAAGAEVPEKTLAQQLTIDVAVHVGTLFAVCIYFRRDIGDMIAGILRLFAGRVDAGARLAILILVSFVPLALVGFFFKDAIALNLHDIEVVAWATIGFAVVLYLADRAGMTLRRIEHMTILGAVLIGLSQVLALIPGTSRSGITMSMARALGFERQEAARFSMLMSIPAIAAAGVLVGADLIRSNNVQVGLDAMVAAVLAFVFALAAIAFLMAWLRRSSFTPFVIYRLVLGAVLLYWVYGVSPA